jgi:hypothetical protein
MLERKEKEREKNSTTGIGMPVKKWKGQKEDGRM